MDASRNGPGLALAAAVLFGLSAPAAKLLASRSIRGCSPACSISARASASASTVWPSGSSDA